MVRILHFSDLHLDCSFASIGMASNEATKRREELRAALRRIIDRAIELQVDAVTVGGDLYEHDRATRDTGRFIADQFARFAPKPVFVAPGNHDRLVPDSLYEQLSWPPNVRIFRGDNWQSFPITGGVTIWGIGHQGPSVRENLLQSLRLDPASSSVAVMHASDTSGVPWGKTAHAPFQPADVEECGARFVLLGHYHGMSIKPSNAPKYAYPGSPEPLGFGEEGQHFVLILTVNQDAADVQTLSINEVWYRSANIDVTGFSTSDEIRQAILRLAGDPSSNCIQRVTLMGQADPDIQVDSPALLATTADSFRYLDLIDRTEPAFDLDELSEDPTTRGTFVKMMRDRIASAENEEERFRLQNALRYGLEAFSQQRVRVR